MARADRLSPAETGPDLSGRGLHGHRLLGVRAQIAHPAHAEAGMTPERIAVVGFAPDLLRFSNVRIADTGRWAA